MFKKVQSQKTSIANRAITLRDQGKDSMSLLFSDHLAPYKEVFEQLLGPKKLIGIKAEGNSLRIKDGESEITEDQLSSGEREVVNIAFDFLLRRPSDCIVFFDEPELHLHPELANRMINSLRSIGENNQFLFCTHSSELISSNLDNTVIFIRPVNDQDENQAIIVSHDDSTSVALKAIGQSIGVVSLGKKIVLIEGNSTSLDKKTYLQILNGAFPSLVLVPCEGKFTLQSFSNVTRNVLEKTIWGVKFFLLSDRDAYPEELAQKIRERGLELRIKSLSKYHLENYFLDENIIAAIFEDMEPEDSWLRDPDQIKAEMQRIATSRIPYSVALTVSKYFRDVVGNIDIMPKGCDAITKEVLLAKFQDRLTEETTRFDEHLTSAAIDEKIKYYFEKFSRSTKSDDWKDDIPGKQVLSMFASKAGIREDRLKSMYIRRALSIETGPFDEIVGIFKDFAENRE